MTTEGPRTSDDIFVFDARPSHGDWEVEEYRRAREQGYRCVRWLGMKAFLGHADVVALRRDRRLVEVGPRLLTDQGISDGPLFEWWCRIMFNTEGAPHHRLRALVSKAFAAHGIERLRPAVRALVTRLCHGLAEREEIDVVADLAREIPDRAMCLLSGVPLEDVDVFARWSSDFGRVFSFAISPATRAVLEQSIGELQDDAKALVAERRHRPKDDLISALLEAREEGDRLSEEALVALIANLFLAGSDTVKHLIANGVLMLLRHPAQWKKLVADTSLAAPAVEEIVRVAPSAPNLPRMATEQFEHNGIPIERDEKIVLGLMAANRDPATFPDPERFDITRSGAEVLSFGLGLHYCIGAALTRLEAQETFVALASHFPRMELVDQALEWTPIAEFRGPVSLRVRRGLSG